MSLDDVVSVSISRETAQIETAGFKQMLALGAHVRTYDRVAWYASLAEMVAAGFLTGDDLYIMASDYFAQDPKPIQIAIGKVTCDEVTVSIDSVENSTTYQIIIESETPGTPTTFQFVSDSDATQTEIADGLVADINGGTEPLTASNVGDDVKLVNDVSGALFAVSVNSTTLMTVGTPTTLQEPDAALNQIVLEDNTWYGLSYASRTQADVETVADWAETVYKLFGTASSDANIIGQTVGADSTSIAAYVKDQALARSFVMYSASAATEYPECAAFGACLTYDPDVEHITWAFKTLSSITVDTLTSTQRNNAWNKYCNTYETVAAANITRWGTVGANEYIDIILGADWLRARLQEDIYERLVNLPKIPYTDKGIGSLSAIVRKDLETAQDVGFIDAITSISAPDRVDVSAANVAARLLQNLTFAATVAGAIHKVEISGTVTV
jgi:hypothetical protein